MEHPTIAIPVTPSRCQLQELFHHFPRDDLPRDDLPRDDKVKFKDSSKTSEKRMKFKHKYQCRTDAQMPNFRRGCLYLKGFFNTKQASL